MLRLNALKNRAVKKLTKLRQMHWPTVRRHSQELMVFTGLQTIRTWEPIYQWMHKNKSFSSYVIIPWLIVACYIGIFQSHQYESVAKILIEKDSDKTPFNISFGFLGNNGTNDSSTVFLTQEFIMSREMQETLQHILNIKSIYQSKNIDILSRLKQHPTQKELLKYYQKKIIAEVDPVTKEINIAVRAFTPNEAKKIIAAVIQQTKVFVNRVSNSLADKQFHFAKLQLHLAKQKLFDAEKSILEFQNTHGLFDPKETARVVTGVMAQLKGDLVKKQTELITYESFMQPESSKIIALKEEIEALKHQMEIQTNDMLGKREGKDNKLNQIMVDYEWLELGLKFAQAEYQAAQQAYDIGNVNLAKQQHMVIEIATPNLPDDYEYPKILYNLVNLFVLLVILFLLGKMTYIIVQEHID